jgi:hypothetical protein
MFEDTFLENVLFRTDGDLLFKFLKLFVTEKLSLKVDSAASGRGQAKLTCFVCFFWPSLEVEPSISMCIFVLDFVHYQCSEMCLLPAPVKMYEM